MITDKVQSAFAMFIQMPDKESRKMVNKIAMQSLDLTEKIIFTKAINDWLINIH